MGNTIITCCGGYYDDDDLDLDLSLPFLSEDFFIHQILVCLPVKSLLRFKSVSKSWLKLIDSSFFIDLHTTTTTTFNSSSTSSKFGSFILHASRKMVMLSSSGFVSVSGGGAGGDTITTTTTGDDDIIITDNDYYQADYLGFPPFCNDSIMHSRLCIHMVGSCNGLICLHESRNKVVSLWNPATRQFRNLPKPIPIQVEGIDYVVDFVAFGFDVKTKDYKVVNFSCFRTTTLWDKWFSRVQVYSLSTNSWRPLEGIYYLPARPYTRVHQNQGIYMNGCYFFVGKNEFEAWRLGVGNSRIIYNNCLMYSFDFTNEILTTMQFPDHDSRRDLILSYLGDKMALFMIRRNFVIGGSGSDCGLDYEYYDIWVLNGEQPGSGSDMVVNKESWTKLHSFPKINKLKHPTQPRCISNNGEFALISTKSNRSSSRELQLFNLVTKEAKKNFPIGHDLLRADVYTQSLVSIIGGNGAAAATKTADDI